MSNVILSLAFGAVAVWEIARAGTITPTAVLAGVLLLDLLV